MAILVPAADIVGCDRAHSDINCLAQILSSDEIFVPPQPVLDFAEGGLDGRQVGRVRRPRDHSMSSCVEDVDRRVTSKMCRQIIPKDRALYIGRESRVQKMLNKEREHICIGILRINPPSHRADDDVDRQEQVELDICPRWLVKKPMRNP